MEDKAQSFGLPSSSSFLYFPSSKFQGPQFDLVRLADHFYFMTQPYNLEKTITFPRPPPLEGRPLSYIAMRVLERVQASLFSFENCAIMGPGSKACANPITLTMVFLHWTTVNYCQKLMAL